ncbi:MAG: murein biosynthesis integral membrane protein MurJ [Candidatus Omnitrophica bacterium]|nr:murein biosynthesis integral membrane protein MurJ [Candidatus Omnitrophota bacterium]
MYRKIAKNTGIVSLGTLTSRILGALRDAIIANYFGTSGVLESFLVAFRIPNIFRDLFGEGFSDAIATPTFSQIAHDRKKLVALGEKVLSLLTVTLAVFTLLGIIFAKYLVVLIAPGFLTDPEKFAMTVSYTRVTFIYLFFIGLISLMSSLLYALKRFFIPAFLPMLFNASLIVGLVFFSRYFQHYILVVSVIIAGLIQYIVVYWGLRHQHLTLRFRWGEGFGDPQIKTMLRRFFPRVGASVVYHLNVFIDTVFSSLSWIVGEGGVAAIYYANRIIQFPLALISVSLARVIIVDLSGFGGHKNMDEFKRLFVFAIRNMFFFIVPLSIVFLFMPYEIIEVIFLRGRFGRDSLGITGSVLFFYSWGLLPFCTVKLLVHSFYSLKDTVTPAKISAIALVVNVVLSAILMFPLRISGVALASSIAASLQTLLLYRALIGKIGPIPWREIVYDTVKLLLLGGVIAVVVKVFWVWGPDVNKYWKCGIDVILGGTIFIIIGMILRLDQFNHLKRWILPKK